MWLLSKPSIDFPFSGRAGRWLSVASWQGLANALYPSNHFSPEFQSLEYLE
jgi:hypothetical protein